MTNDKTHRQPTDGLGDYGRTYLEAVQIIAAALREFSNVVCTPADYRHNAKAILARLAHSDILVEKVNYQPDADNVDNIHADHQAALLGAASLHANMTQPEQTNAIDRRKADAIRLAEIRQRLDTDTTARQEAIANFVLSTAAMAKQLREALDIKATGIDAQAMPRFDDFIDELTYRIRFHFQQKFGRDLFDCPPVNFNVDSEPRPMPADHQAALLKAASLHANMTQPVPGWPAVIYTQTGDDSALGIVNRTTALNMPAHIARPAAAESMTQPPADGGE